MVNKNNRLISLIGILFLALLLLGTSCGKPAGAPASGPAGSVIISPKSQNAKVGSTIKVSLELTPADWGVSGAEVQVSFDPTKLEAVSVKAGSALGENPLEGTRKIDNNAGTIVYALARQGETTAPGARGALSTIEFRGKSGATGTAKIELTRAGLSDENFQTITGITIEGAAIVFP